MDIKEYIIQHRRHIHQNPELGFETFKTAQYVASVLNDLGYKIQYVLNNAGLIATLDLGHKKTIAFRSDMDALKITEETNLEFASKNGCMHACGHDAHTAILLGAARLLMENKEKLNVNVKLIFQPAEEGPLPGGAFPIIQTGLLDDVNMFFAFHVTNKLYTNQIGVKPREACSAPDQWVCEIEGIGCHASTPHLGANPIMPMALIIDRFQKLYDSIEEPNVVIATTYVNAGVSLNIIPSKAILKGTARSFSENMRKYLKKEMTKIAEETAKEYHTHANFDFQFAYNSLYNDEQACQIVLTSAEHIYPKENVLTFTKPEMVGEDFSYYRKIAPICLCWVGVRNVNAPFYDLHSPHFTVDEEALYNAALLFQEIALSF